MIVGAASAILIGFTFHFIQTTKKVEDARVIGGPMTPLESCDFKPKLLELPWSSDAASRAAALGVPVLFKNATSEALHNLDWSWSKVANVDVNVTVEKASEFSSFFYFDDESLGLLDHRDHQFALSRLTEPGPRSRRGEKMHMSDFVRRITSNVSKVSTQKRDFLYLTAPVFPPSSTDSDYAAFSEAMRAQFWGEMSAVDPSLVVGSQPLEPVLSVWMGGRGVTTQSHYDEPHNMFLQLIGTKKFTILPPCAIDALPLYPDLHVRARKSQFTLSQIAKGTLKKSNLDFSLHDFFFISDSTEDSSTETRRLRSLLEVQVSRGDVIYLPPYYVHRVEVMSKSAASYNVFTHSNYSTLRTAIYQHPLPFEESWKGSAIGGPAIHLWLIELVEFRLGWSLHDVSDRLVHGRYEWMVEKHNGNDHQVTYKCYDKNSLAEVEKFGVNRLRFSDYADKVASLFLSIGEDGIRWQILLSYVELLIYNILGGVGELKPYLKACIAK